MLHVIHQVHISTQCADEHIGYSCSKLVSIWEYDFRYNTWTRVGHRDTLDGNDFCLNDALKFDMRVPIAYRPT